MSDREEEILAEVMSGKIEVELQPHPSDPSVLVGEYEGYKFIVARDLKAIRVENLTTRIDGINLTIGQLTVGPVSLEFEEDFPIGAIGPFQTGKIVTPKQTIRLEPEPPQPPQDR